MDYVRTIYPPLTDRQSLPVLYLPTAYALYALTPFLPGKSSRVLITFPLLLILAAGRPYYATGDVNGDYGTSGALLGLCLMYLDFFILSLLEGDEARFQGVGEDDCRTTSEKVKWALRLTTATRGIGWNWQVKGVPPHPTADIERFTFARKQLLGAARSWCYKISALCLLSFALTIEARTESAHLKIISNAAIGWCGAAWAWNGVTSIYRFGAAITVAVDMCKPWEWPPMFGSLRDGWSVRQMWSAVWHQIIRRVAQKPAVRLARAVGLHKGSLGSKYTQLYLAFALSMLVHEWQIFNAVRHDVGEFRFFMAQPFAITLEDFLGWCWRRYVRLQRRSRWGTVVRSFGYIWTFVWFSYCLPPFIRGLLRVDIVGADIAGPWAMALGQEQAIALLR